MEPFQKTYDVPEVVRDGEGPFQIVPNPMDQFILDPKNPLSWVASAEYSWQTVIKKRSPVNNKKTPHSEIKELISLAEEEFERRFFLPQATALISGMPIILRTNSPHLYNFWSRNWYLGSIDEVRRRFDYLGNGPITIRAVMGLKDSLGKSLAIGAYYCPHCRQIVFVNTDYYGQCKSWALGAAGVGLADFKIHSIHGACVEIGGAGILIIAPTGTGKSTYTNQLASYGFINSDDWVYVKEENGEFFAYPSERYIYVRSNAVQDDPEKGHSLEEALKNSVMCQQWEIFEKSPAENVPIAAGQRVYERVPNSRVLINPKLLAPMSFKTPIKAVILLRRDSFSPYKVELTPDQAVKVLAVGEYALAPGVTDDPKEWGKLAYEPWYNPYLLEPNAQFETERFLALGQKARCVIYNTGSQFAKRKNDDSSPDLRHLIEETTQDMLQYVS